MTSFYFFFHPSLTPPPPPSKVIQSANVWKSFTVLGIILLLFSQLHKMKLCFLRHFNQRYPAWLKSLLGMTPNVSTWKVIFTQPKYYCCSSIIHVNRRVTGELSTQGHIPYFKNLKCSNTQKCLKIPLLKYNVPAINLNVRNNVLISQ